MLATDAQLILMDATGKIIQHATLFAENKTFTFDATHLANGIYFLLIERDGHAPQIMKVYK